VSTAALAPFPATIREDQRKWLSIRTGLVRPDMLFRPRYVWNVVQGMKQPTPGWSHPGRGPLPEISRHTPAGCLVWCGYESLDHYGARACVAWSEKTSFAMALVAGMEEGARTVLGGAAGRRCTNGRAESISLTDWKDGVTLVRLTSEVATPHVCLVDTAELRALLDTAEWKGA